MRMINSGRCCLEPVRQNWAGQIERVRTSEQTQRQQTESGQQSRQ